MNGTHRSIGCALGLVFATQAGALRVAYSEAR